MAQRKLILEEIAALNSLKDLAQSYEEIAATRMQKIKNTVLKTRGFLSELSDIFVDLKSSYQREVVELLDRRRKGDKTLTTNLQKNGKTLMVYLASNGRLYGSVTKKTFDLLVQDFRNSDEHKTDLIIIGAAGKEMYENSSIKRPFVYYDIPDDNIKIDQIKALMKKYLDYESVHIYYGKFGNVVKQDAISTSITGEDIFETEVPAAIPREDRFIFEPVLDKIFHFFETQIMANLFSQTYLENQLARQASRVNAMEEALIHIEENAKKLNQQKIRLKHSIQNKKQLETVSGFLLWDME